MIEVTSRLGSDMYGLRSSMRLVHVWPHILPRMCDGIRPPFGKTEALYLVISLARV